MIEDRAARSRILDDIVERQRHTAAILDSNEKSNRLAQLQASVLWLAADDKKQEAERLRRSGMKHPGTCAWIAQVPEMKSWLQDDSLDSIIWLNGKPGAGMSQNHRHKTLL